MGKKTDKGLGKEKGQSSSASQENVDEDPSKSPEPYTCTGMFHNDFSELCRRECMAVVPPVIMRPRRPPSPSTLAAEESKAIKKDKKDDKKNQPPPEPDPEPETDENGEPIEPPPKTYTLKESNEYFKPSVQVEMDHQDKQDTVTEVYVRGWKIDVKMMNIFQQSFVKLDRLHTINFWNTGLDEETLDYLACFIPDCLNLRNLSLDNNPVKEEGWHKFLSDESPVQYLSLRYNQITDKGAQLLAKSLGTTLKQNQRLLSLNLNGNQITNKGLTAIANGLRMNRTLLSLSLASNKISDAGAKELAEVLSRFPLIHEEIVERRKLLSEKGSPERQKSPPPGTGRRADSRDRPGSVRSSSHAGTSKGGKSAKSKKDTKGKDDEKDKKGKKDSGNVKKPSSLTDLNKTQKKGDKAKSKGKGSTTGTESEVQETTEIVNPLLDTVERLNNGVIMLAGNRSLINLNLSSNLIGEEGMKALLLAVGYQTSLTQFQSHTKLGSSGLMRLVLNKNLLSADSDHIQKLNAMMQLKDPFYKAAAVSPDLESVQS